MQETQDSLVDWAESLTELSTMKTDLSQYIMAEDVLLLQEQVEHLRCQWEELCNKVRVTELMLETHWSHVFTMWWFFLLVLV